MSGEVREKVFRPQILGYLDFIKNNETFKKNPAYQKQQFMMSLREIWAKFQEKIIGNKSTITPEEYQKMLTSGAYKAVEMLKKYGMDISYETLVTNDKAKLDIILSEAYDKFIHNSTDEDERINITQSKVRQKFNMAFT